MHPNDNTPDTIPYGYCHCGCGEKTAIAKWSDRRYGRVKGEPVRYIQHHHMPIPEAYIPPASANVTPYGYCHCGCGGKTKIARNTDRRRGHVEGQPIWYICGHHTAKTPVKNFLGNVKRCSGCKQELPVEKFCRDTSTRSGLNPYCRTCRRAIANNRRVRIWPKSGQVSAAEWHSILDRFGGKCAKCGSSENIHMDHVVPLAKGGKHSVDNVQPLCQTCNLRKFTKVEDYRGKLYRPLALPLDDIA